MENEIIGYGWNLNRRCVCISKNGATAQEISRQDAFWLIQRPVMMMFIAPIPTIPTSWNGALDTQNCAHVYFLETIGLAKRYVKIGRSRTPRARCNAIVGNTFIEMKIRGSVKGPITLERELHALFSFRRVRGEWFELDDRLSAALRYANEFKGKYQTIEHFRCAVDGEPSIPQVVEMSKADSEARALLLTAARGCMRNEVQDYLIRRALIVYCPSCGTTPLEGTQFCAQCGTKFTVKQSSSKCGSNIPV